MPKSCRMPAVESHPSTPSVAPCPFPPVTTVAVLRTAAGPRTAKGVPAAASQLLGQMAAATPHIVSTMADGKTKLKSARLRAPGRETRSSWGTDKCSRHPSLPPGYKNKTEIPGRHWCRRQCLTTWFKQILLRPTFLPEPKVKPSLHGVQSKRLSILASGPSFALFFWQPS
jgi:hypothetical protein